MEPCVVLGFVRSQGHGYEMLVRNRDSSRTFRARHSLFVELKVDIGPACEDAGEWLKEFEEKEKPQGEFRP